MGADDLDGGDEGWKGDTAAYTMSEEGVTIDLGARGGPSAKGGDAMGDTLDDIENVRGSMHDDMLTGDGGPNTLYGNQGDDELMGGAGNDMLRGDKGDDTLTGGDGDDTFILMEGDGDDTIEDFESGDDTIQFGPATEKLFALRHPGHPRHRGRERRWLHLRVGGRLGHRRSAAHGGRPRRAGAVDLLG